MTPHVLIVVPTYDNPLTIVAVVSGLLATQPHAILVVDDGSSQPVAIKHERVVVVRHLANLGKGAALRTAFKWALAHGFTHALTFDGDGQHLAACVPALLEKANQEPWSVVIGVRQFPAANVPGASRFGRAFSNFWIRYETGFDVHDSQSGLRVYPLFHVQMLKLGTKRFDFEVEVLTLLLWNGAGLAEVPVDVHYPPAAERVSHFDKGADNIRISLLNVKLVVLSLFQRHLDLRGLARAALIIPCIVLAPWPLALTLAAATLAAVVMQLNAFLALGAWAAIVFLPWSIPWNLGAMSGALLSAALALAVRRKKLPSAQAWTGKMRGGRFGNGFLRVVSKAFGRGATYFCLAFITPYFYLFAPKARRASLEFFRVARPKSRWIQRHGHVLAHFYAFGMVLLDRLYQSQRQGAAFAIAVDPAGQAMFDRTAAQGNGAILLTAHAGGWDLATRMLTARAGTPAAVVAEFVAKGTQSAARTTAARISIHNQVAPIFAYREALAEGQVVAMMGDRPMAGKLALLPFMGKLAAFDLTPFRMAQALSVDVIFCFAFKTSYRDYALTLEKARGDTPEAALRSYVVALEEHVMRHPHQWFNFFSFFSARPAAPSRN